MASNWTSLGQFTNQAEITAKAPAGTMARYVRLKATAANGNGLVQIREFQVLAPLRACLPLWLPLRITR